MKTARVDRPRRAALSAAISGALCAVLMASALPAHAAFDLAALTALLAQRKSAEARFTEERFVSGFEDPLRASGTLSFTAPDRFTRITLQPRREAMVVDGNVLKLERGGRTRTMALDAVPEVTALVEAVRGTFNGDAATLGKHFTARVEGSPAKWTLTLSPREGRLAAQVRELQIAGQGSELRSVALWLAGGDRSLMLVEPSVSAEKGADRSAEKSADSGARPAAK